MNLKHTILLMSVCALPCFGRTDWPVLKTYSETSLSRVKMPLGGIGTGTISLSGRGSLVDWELQSRPNKGFIPGSYKDWSPQFAIRCETAAGVRVARLLEGPLRPEEYEGWEGCPVPNHGYPRFSRAVFRAAYPLAQVELSDPKVPLDVRLEAMNPLVPGDVAASSIPAALFRWVLRNPLSAPVKAAICGTLVKIDGVELVLLPEAPEGGVVTRTENVREPGWNVSQDRFWRTFLARGLVADSDPSEPHRMPVSQTCVSVEVPAGASRTVSFVLGWRSPHRLAWGNCETNSTVDVGNHHATVYPTAEAAARHLLANLPRLEAETVAFVRRVTDSAAPAVVKEAALFNLSTLRSETCFRTADGHFFAWEGCRDRKGSCYGSCTHVWGYEHALVDLWPDLAREMLDLQFGAASDPQTGHMTFRIGLPLAIARGKGCVAAADGQMQCIVKAFEYWRKAKDDAWLRRTWPAIRRALAFCWIRGGWDADRDGVMEGCQHNTMDVEYYGPNPQMEFLYLAALKASARMADFAGETAFAAECRDLFARGSQWTEAHLFNGRYYEHEIRPVASADAIAPGLRHPNARTDGLSDPDYQLGKGCLIDQLLGDFSAICAGLGPIADPAHARAARATVLAKCRRTAGDDAFNPMRGYAMPGERSLRMAWYPEGRMPRSPFPYYVETMTGFEYVVAALQAADGDWAGAEATVRDIRERYDGVKRNPFDEAECGHHYARALAAWSVFRLWEARGR